MYYSWGPKRILEKAGGVGGVELVRCTSVFDDNGNFCPFFDDTFKTVEADQVILAIGQASETEFCKDFCLLEDQGELKVERGLIAIDRQTQATAMTGVFAGGDVANGPGAVVDALAAGRRAAISIDQYLGGDGVLSPARDKCADGFDYQGRRDKGFSDLKREAPQELPLAERHKGFAEVESCFSDAQAAAEVRRCLQCDLERCLAKNGGKA
jgi:hypothetical protein